MKSSWAVVPLLLACIHGESLGRVATAEQGNPSVAFIQRTMGRAAASTPAKPATIRWMFYGQSITAQAPLAEDWTLTCLPDSTADGKRIHFRVAGSVTGDDGEGFSDERFVSRSGRVVIEPADWHLAWCLQYRKLELPAGFRVTWKTYPQFVSAYKPQPAGTETVLVQHCENAPHELTLRGLADQAGIAMFRIDAPEIVAGGRDAD